ncbi:glycosyl transferase [Caldisphaera lagunensis DSM 15908]|uniref:Glycosyl transferase n=2 Tax=Caldisphaera lagunensis TaxID=200415 RepID=L0AA89_CALLD|nr:glycosyl transferase [Caldisphaera lagunensis DSM 15908]
MVKVARRKILGRRGVFILSNFISNILTIPSFVDSRREGKEKGISAVVLSYNEPDWIDLSLKSISNLVDEYIVVDSSNDETTQIIEELSSKLPIKLIKQPPLGQHIARNEALKHVNYKYVLIWDADFIATDKLIEKIKDFVYNSDDKFYYLVYYPLISFCGDLSHRCRDKYHVEHWLFTWSKKLKYLWDGRIEYLYSPIYYKRVDLSYDPLGYHMRSVKKPERVALSTLFYQTNYYDVKNKKGEEEANKLLEETGLKLYNTKDLKEIGLKIMKEMTINKPCFDYKQLPKEIIDRAIKNGIPLGKC